jgi:hypothetical protein
MRELTRLWTIFILIPALLLGVGCGDPQKSNGDSVETNSTAVKDCNFQDRAIKHNESITAYEKASVEYGESCQSEDRVCRDGSMDGSFEFLACEVAAPENCSFNGQVVEHENSISAFQNSSVPFGQSCVSESRKCDNGALSGSFAYGRCNVGAPHACLFNGMTITHKGSVRAYQNSSVPSGQTCMSEVRACDDGKLSGSYAYASCQVAAPIACLFNGQTIASGSSIAAFQTSSVPFGQQCMREARTCTNGKLNGSYAYASCNVGEPQSCLFNGSTVAHGSSIVTYHNSTVPFGQACMSETRACNNGQLSGSYVYGRCSVGAPAACLFNGQTISSGQQVTAFKYSNGKQSEGCPSERRTCSNGALSGSFSYDACQISLPLPVPVQGFEEIPSGTTNTINALVAGPNEILALGNGGVIRKISQNSSDSLSVLEEKLPDNFHGNLSAGAYGNNQYFIGGASEINVPDNRGVAGSAFTKLTSGSWVSAENSLAPRNPDRGEINSIVNTGKFFLANSIRGRVKAAPNVALSNPWPSVLILGFTAFRGLLPLSETRVLAYGESSAIYILQYHGTSSPCGKEWCTAPSDSNVYLNYWGSASNGSVIVNIGGDGLDRQISSVNGAISTDQGQTWTAISIPTNYKNLYSITHTGSEFIAVGEGGIIFHSTDGKNWAQLASPTSADLKSVIYIKDGAFAGNLFIGGANGKIYRKRLSKVNQIPPGSFSQIPSGTTNTFNALVAGPNEILAIGNGGVIRKLVSSGGVVTANAEPPLPNYAGDLVSGAYGNGEYYIGGSRNAFQPVADGRYDPPVVVGDSKPGYSLFRKNGIQAWENVNSRIEINSDYTLPIVSVSYAGSRFIVCTVNRCVTSSTYAQTGIWKRFLSFGFTFIYGAALPLSENTVLLSLSFGLFRFLTWDPAQVRLCQAQKYSSTDYDICSNGMEISPGDLHDFDTRAAASNGTQIVAIRLDSKLPNAAIGTRTVNSGSFEPLSIPTNGRRLDSITHTGSEFIAVGEGGIIVRSTDGRNWTQLASPTTTELRSVIYIKDGALAGNLFIAGANGKIYQKSLLKF